ncbi:MAG TPA: winged helix-turn-helix domain-containing protein [Candidatus Polarisedimenticolaceae bacterium]|nr:winged helix-turn-helix domain-containing protein [Candidatus Polarisedimenticolaceae bacterium]
MTSDTTRNDHRPSDAIGASPGRFGFGPFTLDRRTGELREDDRVVPLRPLATRALLLLVERRGELVAREELRQCLWGRSAVEWEAGLHQIIRTLRRCLRDDSTRPAYIETVPRRGYRFKGRVRVAGAPRSSRRSMWPRTSYFVGGVLTALGSLTVLACLACLLLAD